MTLTASETSKWRLVVPTFLSSDDVSPERRKHQLGRCDRPNEERKRNFATLLTVGVVHLGAEVRTHEKVGQAGCEI